MHPPVLALGKLSWFRPGAGARLLFAAALLAAGLQAQENPAASEAAAVQADLAAMQEALAFRGSLAAAVAAGTEKPEGALEKLRAAKSVSGLPLGREADFALAAIDLGQRLVQRHPAEAEVFFRAAETALTAEVERTPDEQAKDKALYLQKLALVRGNYLNQPEQAQADAAAAVKLQPKDAYLTQFDRNLKTQVTTAEKLLKQKEAAK